MGEIDTNKYRVKRRHKHKRLDHPFKYPAEREKKLTMKINYVYPA